MKNLEKQIWSLTEMGPKTILGLVVIAIVLLIVWGNLLGIKITAIVIFIYAIGKTAKRTGYKKGYAKGLEEGRRLKE
jgi:hypothetical protein